MISNDGDRKFESLLSQLGCSVIFWTLQVSQTRMKEGTVRNNVNLLQSLNFALPFKRIQPIPTWIPFTEHKVNSVFRYFFIWTIHGLFFIRRRIWRVSQFGWGFGGSWQRKVMEAEHAVIENDICILFVDEMSGIRWLTFASLSQPSTADPSIKTSSLPAR